MTRPQVEFRLTTAQENGSEQQLELGKDAFSHPHFNIFLEQIMTNALKEHDGMVSITGGRNITSLRFVDGIDAVAEISA